MGDDYAVTITCKDWHRFDLSSNEDVWAQFDMLAAAKGVKSAAEFDILEKASGLVYNSNSILADELLRQYLKPVSGCWYDWMHVYLQKGVASEEIYIYSWKVSVPSAFAMMICTSTALLIGAGLDFTSKLREGM